MNVRLIQVYANSIAFNLKIRLSLYKIAVNYLLSLFFMFFISIKFIITFFVFVYIIMYILNIISAVINMSVNELRDFVFENYFNRIGFVKTLKQIFFFALH